MDKPAPGWRLHCTGRSFLRENDVVEVPTYIDSNGIHPLLVKGEIPEECQGLLQVVKSYERLVIEAVKENSYEKALKALSIHPLVPGMEIAKAILDEYIESHTSFFPSLHR